MAADPIDDDELIYRRVPESQGWYDASNQTLQPLSFHPHRQHDTTGISVSRARFKSLEEAARGQPGKTYYVAVLRVGELRHNGIRVVSAPLPDDPGHAEFPDLNASNRRSDRTQELERILVTLTKEVVGPFRTEPDRTEPDTQT